MISKRFKKYSQSQENLKQFSLNNSKGVDETKAITDPNTVFDMENLVVNLDGSVSLRKPLQFVSDLPGEYSDCTAVHLMYDGSSLVKCFKNGSFKVFCKTRSGYTEASYVFKGTSYYTLEDLELSWDTSDTYFDLSAASFINTSTSTIVGNCYIKRTRAAVSNLIDGNLFPEECYTKLPRYLRMELVDNVCTVHIVSPEHNRLVDAEGEVPLNPNMCLDNPFSVRDVYGGTTPTVSGILAYFNESFEVFDSSVDTFSEQYEEALPRGDLTEDVVKRFDLSSGSGIEFPLFKKKSLQGIRFDIALCVDGYAVVPRVVTREHTKYDVTVTALIAPGKIENSNNSVTVSEYPFDMFEDVNFYLVPNQTYEYTFKSSNSKEDNVPKVQLYSCNRIYGKLVINPAEGFETTYPFKKFEITLSKEDVYGVKANIVAEYTDYIQSEELTKVSVTDSDDGVTYVFKNEDLRTARYFKIFFKKSVEDGKICLAFEYVLASYESTIVETLGIRYTFTRDLSVDDYTYTSVPILSKTSEEFSFIVFDATSECSFNTPEFKWSGTAKRTSISTVTENVLPNSFKLTSELKDVNSNIFLKAFGAIPNTSYNISGTFISGYFATWDYSLDGVNWNTHGPLPLTMFPDAVEASYFEATRYSEFENLDDTLKNFPLQYRNKYYVPIKPDGVSHTSARYLCDSIDVLPMSLVNTFMRHYDDYSTDALMLRYTVVTLEYRDAFQYGDNTYDAGYYQASVVASKTFTPYATSKTVLAETDLPNAVLGEKLYYKGSIYSYGSGYNSIVHVSNAGSFVTPMYNVLELGDYADDTVTCVVPWKNYILSTTEKAIYLSTKTDSGFLTKTVSNSIGVPFDDRRTVCPALNGILFKNHDSVYLAYPNLYSGAEDAIILTELSKPVAHSLKEICDDVPIDTRSFIYPHAVLVDNEYVLTLYSDSKSTSYTYVYNLTTKRWTKNYYPIAISTFLKYSEDVIAVYRNSVAYSMFKENSNVSDVSTYADVISPSNRRPIQFSLDTGQKTDSIESAKQFVESKLVFATLHEQDAFPLEVYVAVDGDSHITKTDISTDAPFWKTNANSRGVVGTTFRLGSDVTPATGAFNTLRQLVLRYSGKGRSVRHVIQGESLYNFKLYETYVRYKNLNVK